jgi:hypothetical protein
MSMAHENQCLLYKEANVPIKRMRKNINDPGTRRTMYLAQKGAKTSMTLVQDRQ